MVFDGKNYPLKRAVFIRADANDKIGLGHVMRCFALGQMIKDDFDIRFYCKEIPNELAEEISTAGFKIEKIQREDEFLNRLNANSIVILDGYDFDLAYQKQIKEKQARICCLSDFKANNSFADIILNQAPGVVASDYQTSFSSRFLLGADYALLRPIFFQSSHQSKTPRSIFICFGGADPFNLSLKALELLSSFSNFKRIVIVTGSAFTFLLDIEEFIRNSDQSIEHYHAVDATKMCQLMSQSELAIVPSSSIIYEAMAANCQIISGYYVDNQKMFYEGLKAINCYYDASQFETVNLANALNSYLRHPQPKANIIDKKSPERIRRAISQLAMLADLRVQEMELLDVALTYQWASNPEIRKYAFQQKPIKPEEHNEWFARKSADENVVYLKAFYRNDIIGSVRFDMDGGTATISYLLDPKRHGKGFALPMLMAAMERVALKKTFISRVEGYVMKENLASVRIFENLGFQVIDQNDRYQFFKCDFKY